MPWFPAAACIVYRVRSMVSCMCWAWGRAQTVRHTYAVERGAFWEPYLGGDLYLSMISPWSRCSPWRSLVMQEIHYAVANSVVAASRATAMMSLQTASAMHILAVCVYHSRHQAMLNKVSIQMITHGGHSMPAKCQQFGCSSRKIAVDA